MIILLDGSKGAGKSTAGQLLSTYLDNSMYVSIDTERKLLDRKEGSIQERNREAFEVMMDKCAQYLNEGKNIIIDCGMIQDRVTRIELLAKNKGLPIYKFVLKASYEKQLERVRARDASKGNETDEDRFKEVHKAIHSKQFDNFTTIETEKLNPEEVVQVILSTVGQIK
jgi:thymidylate kinase